MLLEAVLALTLTGAAAPGTGSEPGDTLAALANGHPPCDALNDRGWEALGLSRLSAALNSSAKTKSRVEELGKVYGLPDRAAELFLGAVRSGCVAPQQASELLGQVSEQAPGNVAALWLHARLADASRDRALDADLFKALARAPSPTQVALTMAANGLYRVGDELRFWAFQQDPSLAYR